MLSVSRSLAPVTLALALALAAATAGSCGSPPPLLLPEPRSLATTSAACHPVSRACVIAESETDRLAVSTIVEAAGIATDPNRCDWRVVVSRQPGALPPELDASLATVDSTERFAFSTRNGTDAPTTTLCAPSDAALRYGARRIATRLRRDGAACCVVEEDVLDYPSFPLRGVIEGFYGDPYTVDERHTLLELMAALDMNTFLYGPKGDPYVHDRWAMPYPPDGADAMRALTTHAKRLGIEPVWAVSPAPNVFGYSEASASIHFSSPDDFAKLTDKLSAMHALGFDRFALFVDDTTPELRWADDLAAYESPVAAHADLANRVLAHVRTLVPDAGLWFVGRDYSEYQPGWEDYNARLGVALLPGIDVLWTGPLVYSRTIEVTDVDRIAAVLGRRVILWDNAPESLAPLTGRDAALPSAVGGFLSNAVLNEWRLYSRQEFWRSLGPIGMYQWNPERYDGPRALAWWSQRF